MKIRMLIACVLLVMGSVGVVNGGVPASAVNSDEKGPVVLPTANTAIVPNVVGMVYKEAIPVIQGAGFYANHKSGSLSAKKNKRIVSQSPAAGTRAQKKTFIIVDVP